MSMWNISFQQKTTQKSQNKVSAKNILSSHKKTILSLHKHSELWNNVNFQKLIPNILWVALTEFRGCHGRDHMVVGFITTYATSAYHH